MLKLKRFNNASLKSSLLSFSDAQLFIIQCAGLKCYPPPKPIDDSDWPENRKLKIIDKVPQFPTSQKPPKMMKMLRLMRGPEETNNELLYEQYGVKALLGGRMKFQHFEAIRRIVQSKLDVSRMFVHWRIEGPWQPMCKKGVGKRMGMGKGSTHHYATPVKADRIIIELGGDLHPFEAKEILAPIAEILPFAARFVSQKYMNEEKENNKWVEQNNVNPFSMEYIIKNNMGGCHKWLSPYDHEWFGRYK